MIEFTDIKQLGFKKVRGNDSVYENRYGRQYFWMEYTATVLLKGGKNEITFNWDCDKLTVSVFKNDTEKIAEFDEYDKFINYFAIFMK